MCEIALFLHFCNNINNHATEFCCIVCITVCVTVRLKLDIVMYIHFYKELGDNIVTFCDDMVNRLCIFC